MVESYYSQEEVFLGTYGNTSTVIYECFSNKETVIKEYWGFDYEDICLYQDIQNQAKKEIDGIYDVKNENLRRYNEKIKKIDIEILYLDQDNLTHSCYYKDKSGFGLEGFPIIRLPYIEGDTFADLIPDGICSCEDYRNELHNLYTYIQEIFHQKTKISSDQLFADNVKVVGFDEGILQIIITDVAGDIKELIKGY